MVAETINLKARLIGVGNFGCKILDYIAAKRYRNLQLVAIDTDIQSLLNSQAHKRILIGDQLTHGYGTQGDPNLGRRAAEESENELRESIKGNDYVFLVAGLGGGTGTGALPYISKIAKECGVLTIGAVLLPFSFEGNIRMELAKSGVYDIKNHIHTLVTVPGDSLLSRVNGELSLDDSIAFFGDTLFSNIVSTFRLVNVDSLISLDISDIQLLLLGGNSALMACGQAPEGNPELAVKDAIENVLGSINLSDAKNVLFNVTGSSSMSLFEVNQIASAVKSKSSPDVKLLFGAVTRPSREDLEVTIIATGAKDEEAEIKVSDETISTLPDSSINQKMNESTPRLKVFLCHSSTDKPVVRKLFQRLYSRKGIDPWLDEAKLLPGVRWDTEVVKAVKESDVVVVCISNNSVSKEGYVQKEIKRALDIADEKPEGTIFIIPLKLEECNVPERLSQWQWVNYYEDGAFEKLMSSLRIRGRSIGVEVV
jgi:cell division protein FtsZ